MRSDTKARIGYTCAQLIFNIAPPLLSVLHLTYPNLFPDHGIRSDRDTDRTREVVPVVVKSIMMCGYVIIIAMK